MTTQPSSLTFDPALAEVLAERAGRFRMPTWGVCSATRGLIILGTLALLLAALLGFRGAEARSLLAAPTPIRPGLDLDGCEDVQPGDLIFRRGDSLASRAVLAVDDAIYSHVGIAVRDAGGLRVVHAAPGESFETPEKVTIEPLERFLAREAASAAAVYRPVATAPRVGAAAAEVATGFAERNLGFDTRFSLATPDTLYCTELVWRAYLETGFDLLDAPASELDTLVLRGPVILPSDLLTSSKIEKILIFKTKENDDAP